MWLSVYTSVLRLPENRIRRTCGFALILLILTVAGIRIRLRGFRLSTELNDFLVGAVFVCSRSKFEYRLIDILLFSFELPDNTLHWAPLIISICECGRPISEASVAAT